MTTPEESKLNCPRKRVVVLRVCGFSIGDDYRVSQIQCMYNILTLVLTPEIEMSTHNMQCVFYRV